MTTPDILYDNSNSTSSWYAGYYYKFRSTTTLFATYDLWDTSTSNWYTGTISTGGWKIKVGIDSSNTTTYNKWFDEGSNQPTSVVENGLNVELYTGPTLSYQFLKPTTASWIATGDTSSEEVLVPNAAITGGTFVQSGFPAGDYGLSNFSYDYGSYTGPYQVFWTVSTATNSDQHTITGLSFGTFLLSNNVVGLASPQTLIYGASAVTKVHCNFW